LDNKHWALAILTPSILTFAVSQVGNASWRFGDASRVLSKRRRLAKSSVDWRARRQPGQQHFCLDAARASDLPDKPHSPVFRWLRIHVLRQLGTTTPASTRQCTDLKVGRDARQEIATDLALERLIRII
jgi:hypothetical protein